MQRKPHVVVVGGGISGLTAAYRLTRAGTSVTVLESTPRMGGKLAASPVAGVPVDAGAESVLRRRPEALALISDLGLDDRVTSPAPAPASIYSRGRLRAFPEGQMMGVPGDLAALARSGVLSWPGTLRVAADLLLPGTSVDDDVSVASYIGRRMGREVVDRLVEPLLGGVYAGRADQLSLRATLPQIEQLAHGERSLARAVRAAKAKQTAAPGGSGPVFATLRGGLATLIDALVEQSGAETITACPVRGLRRDGAGWTVTAGSEQAPREFAADGVVLACPAPAAARILDPLAPSAARELAAVDYASMAIVTLAYPASAFPRPPEGSGFLVPGREGRTIKAATFSSVKWPWLGEALRAAHPDTETVLLRASIGRFGEEEALRRDDAELTALATADLADICGVSGAPVDQRVTRWEAGLPQYVTGHLDRVERARAVLSDHTGLVLCGAAYDGVGIPACVGGAESAARALAAQLADDHRSPQPAE
ncbi:protoporphyrinogen oxidase [Nocardiopsis gilva YIM 90087]|uniref:Coproporphyrinogen III oxidase n=1 Tax=Nocardiopsis gilva YIM 90087 TaxID=1235441 RepID=A0A223S8H7_9ACTN|nr:protoporphyrinogen oxidase [Nocardiopsis gilva]ASU84425.1 protoporphyrinogen oxidase [Nocardiopsis gilva YIM 90087]